MMCSVLGLCLTLIDVLDQSFVLEAADHRERERERERERLVLTPSSRCLRSRPQIE